MRRSKDLFTQSFEAAATLPAQNTFVKPSAGVSGGVSMRVAKAGAGEQSIGIAQDTPSAVGLACAVRMQGTSKLKVDGSGTPITVGTYLKSDASGRGVAVASNNDHYGARALEASSAADDVIEVEVVRGFYGA